MMVTRSSRLLRVAPFIVALSACALTHREPPPPVNTPELPIAPDEAADSLLVDVQRVDSAILVDLRYGTANNFSGAPLPGYAANRAYLRAEAAAALALAAADLRREGYGVKIYDAYRPVRASDAMVQWAQRTGRTDLLRDGYIAARSRHNLGAAVDLTLVNVAGQEMPMGTAFDTFSRAAWTKNASGVIAKNRQKLKTAMERQGFANYPNEWWHFSYEVANPVRFDRVIR